MARFPLRRAIAVGFWLAGTAPPAAPPRAPPQAWHCGRSPAPHPGASRQAAARARAQRKGSFTESLAWREDRAGDDHHDRAAVTLLALPLSRASLSAHPPPPWPPSSAKAAKAVVDG
jgi:hypothetical protein